MYVCVCMYVCMYRISSNSVYFFRDSADRRICISCPRPPTLGSARRGRSVRATVWQAKGAIVTLNLKDTSKHLFCAIGVPVGEVQLAPLGLRQLATPPSWSEYFVGTHFRLRIFFKAKVRMHNRETTPLRMLIVEAKVRHLLFSALGNQLKGESEDASSVLCETISVQATVVGRRKCIQKAIEARRLFALLPIPPAFKRGWRLFEGGVYSKLYVCILPVSHGLRVRVSMTYIRIRICVYTWVHVRWASHER